MASNIDSVCKLIQAKLEVTYRTDPVPVVGTDDIYCRKIDFQPNIARADKPRVGARPTGLGTELASLSDKLDIEFDMVGMADAPLTVPRWFRFLQACGMIVTPSGGPVNTQTLTFDTRTNLASLTVIVFMFASGAASSVKHTVTGVRGKFDIEMAVNQTIICKLMMEGYHEAQADATPTLASIAYDATAADAVAARDVVFTIGGVGVNVKKFSLKTNREVNRVDTITDTLAVGKVRSYAPAGKTHELNIDLEMQLLADYNHWQRLFDQDEVAWSIAWLSPAGSNMAIAGAKLQLKDLKYEEDGAITRINATYEIIDGVGLENGFSIVSTAP